MKEKIRLKIQNALEQITIPQLIIVGILGGVGMSVLITCVMSIVFWGKVTNHYPVTGAVAAFFVSLVVLPLLSFFTIRLKESKELLNKKIEEEKADIKYRIVADNTYNWEYWISPECKFIYVSPSCLRISGYSADQFLADEKLFISIIKEEDKQKYLDAYNKNNAEIELRIKKADGTECVVNQLCNKVYDNKGNYLGRRGSIADITEKKKIEEALKMNEEIFNKFMEYSPIYVFFKDKEIRPIVLSKNFEKMLKMPINEILGKSMYELFPSELAKSMVADDKTILEEGKVVEVEEVLNGTTYSTIKFPIYKNGVPEMLAGFTIDISEKKLVEEELKVAIEKAEASTRAKSAFLANMSHELRTPLNGIIGMTEILSYSKLDNKQESFVKTIKYSSQTLLEIVNDLLDLSKIESSKVEMQNLEFNLENVFNSLESLYMNRAEKKNISLKKQVDAELPKYILGDESKIKQVLTNFISNAIKFTEIGEVVIGARLEKELEESYEVEFFVKDTGIGISDDLAREIFQPFVQGDIGFTKKYQGTGIGLAISKRLINLMNGTIKLESKERKGTMLSFKLELKKSKNQEKIGSKIVKNVGIKKILIAEDNDINMDTLVEMIGLVGEYKVLMAYNGNEAVEIFEKETPDLVFMDIQMPVKNGFEASLEIREIAKKRNINVKIAALTAYAMAEDRERCLAHGMDYYVSKPCTIRDIQSIIDELSGEWS